MVHVINEGPGWTRVRATWSIVQRASAQKDWRYSRHKRVRTDGTENLLVGGSKAFVKTSNGIWLIKGEKADNSDISIALKAMKVSWAEAQQQGKVLVLEST